MTLDPGLERRREAAYRRLGTRQPVCVACGTSGEEPWNYEFHHVAGRAFDGTVVIVCTPCHRTLSDPTANRPARADPPLLERAGRLFDGLAAFLELLVVTLRRYAAELLAAAQVCPWPYGWVGAETGP